MAPKGKISLYVHIWRDCPRSLFYTTESVIRYPIARQLKSPYRAVATISDTLNDLDSKENGEIWIPVRSLIHNLDLYQISF